MVLENEVHIWIFQIIKRCHFKYFFHIFIIGSLFPPYTHKFQMATGLHVKNRIITNDFYNLKVGKGLLSKRQNSEVIREKISRYDYIKHFTSLYSKNNIER